MGRIDKILLIGEYIITEKNLVIRLYNDFIYVFVINSFKWF